MIRKHPQRSTLSMALVMALAAPAAATTSSQAYISCMQGKGYSVTP